MYKTVSFFLLLCLAIGAVVYFTSSREMPAETYHYEPPLYTYMPWLPVVYTYKDYTGKLDESYLEISRKKYEAGACRPFYNRFSLMEDALVKAHADAGNGEAMYEYAGRQFLGFFDLDKLPTHLGAVISTFPSRRELYRNMPAAELEELASAGNEEAISELFIRNLTTMDDYIEQSRRMGYVKGPEGDLGDEVFLNEKIAYFSRFESVTPDAAFFLMMYDYKLNKKFNRDYYLRLKEAGGFPALMLTGAELETQYEGVIDKDVYCEAYFNGCYHAYENSIKKYDIKCGD